MTLLLGLDTGGTFTDAALLRADADGRAIGLVAKAKALTTKHDLALGIASAMRAVLDEAQCAPSDIALVSMSTTLATNALVEGQGGRVAFVPIGFAPRDLERAGLAEAIGSDPVVALAGGHGSHGAEAAALDLAPLERVIDELADTVAGFAIAGYFAVRNPAHENAVRNWLADRTGLPVTCSHELSARLNGPKRALTTILNARLVAMIARLIAATRRTLADNAIDAPLMVVRGDGALVSAAFATARPIETILSGPAASLVGARWLTGLDNALVNDIGGTTSDIALLQDGRPTIDPDGARVGGYRTMVEAVAISTFGLGGDSEIQLGGSSLKPELVLGPRRLEPVSLLATTHSDIVHHALNEQLRSALPGRYDARFVRALPGVPVSGLRRNEQALFERLSDRPVPVASIVEGQAQHAVLNALVARGIAIVAGPTPSDALHVLGRQQGWDADAARKALLLFGRQRDGGGRAWCTDADELAARVLARVERRSADVALETAFLADGRHAELARHALVAETLDRREAGVTSNGIVDVSIALDRPYVGLGASAQIYHPKAARLLGTEADVPEHAGVANAIGAVVGQISVRSDVVVTQPSEGSFSVVGIDQPFADEVTALAAARSLAAGQARARASEAGAGEIELTMSEEFRRADIEARTLFVEARITALATGRPPLAV